MTVHQRHPYAGKLVYTAFSGSHQDAIKKGMAMMREHSETWAVPYLPIDPRDVGRNYDPIIRINSQSGKGGVAYVLEQFYGLILPRPVQQEFSLAVTQVSDRRNSDLRPDEIHQLFLDTYVNITKPIELKSYQENMIDDQHVEMAAVIYHQGAEVAVRGSGNGLLDAFCAALRQHLGIRLEITAYQEHALERGSTSKAITYVQIQNGGEKLFIGCGVSSSISKSSLRAVISAVNRLSMASQA